MKTATALQTATAFNGTIVNTGVLMNMFDGVDAFFGLVSQDKTEFFPIHGIAAVYGFEPDTFFKLDDSCEIWENQNAFFLINEEHNALLKHSEHTVTNTPLWEEIKRVHSVKEGMFSV